MGEEERLRYRAATSTRLPDELIELLETVTEDRLADDGSDMEKRSREIKQLEDLLLECARVALPQVHHRPRRKQAIRDADLTQL